MLSSAKSRLLVIVFSASARRSLSDIASRAPSATVMTIAKIATDTIISMRVNPLMSAIVGRLGVKPAYSNLPSVCDFYSSDIG